MEFHQLCLLLSILAFVLYCYITLQVDETRVVLLQDNFGAHFWCVDDSSINVLLENASKPVLELCSVSNCSTQSQDRAIACLDKTLKGISFWTVEGVNFIEDEVVELIVSTVKDHELSFSLCHFVTSTSSDFA